MSPLAPAAEAPGATIQDASQVQEVTGQTLFWALLPLALNAMGQESPTAKIIFDAGYLAEGSLVPHLSSPVFVLADCIFDILAIFQAFRTTSPETAPDEDLSSANFPRSQLTVGNISVRLLLFIFGVLPQAIRLFAMKGIPVVQVLAEVFLVGSLARMAAIFAFRLRDDPHRKFQEWFLDWSDGKESLQFFVLLFHAVVCCLSWYQIAQVPYLEHSSLTTDFNNVCVWISAIGATFLVATLCCWILTVFFAPFWRYSHLPYTPLPIWFCVSSLLGYPHHLLKAGETRAACLQGSGTTSCAAAKVCNGRLHCFTKPINITFPLIAAALTGSYILAILLVKGSALISGHSPANVPESIIEEPGTDPRVDVTVVGVTASSSTSKPPGHVDASNPESVTKEPGTDLSVDATIATATANSSVSKPHVYVASSNPELVAKEFATHPSVDAVVVANPTGASTPKTEPEFQDEDAIVFGAAAVLSLFKDIKTLCENLGRSEAYCRWLLTSYLFRKYRQSLPRTIVQSWKGARKSARQNEGEGTLDEEKDCVQPQSLQSPRYVRFPRDLFWLTMLGVIQLMLFFLFAGMTLWDVGQIRKSGTKVAKRCSPAAFWVAFSLFNLATAATYFFVAFEGTGTETPAWTNILNK
ncbi:hypothetical protein CKM354_001051600 [Cercospora kikuchii]|uniref:Uncharacterized protein n=1 Tax=Cercospora kikuchii TaxID=84275 RepID=A0A9P3CX24_9PEZI|nr:uncharacterized protein CKM354_001051600 [Cercospora kikuchii]GIZ47425.1 hypothetical protein CKM354_001051600 [Cercospora kikuchii]